MLNLEERLISLVSRYLTVENSLEENPLSLITTISFKDKQVYKHSLDLTPLIPILKKQLKEE